MTYLEPTFRATVFHFGSRAASLRFGDANRRFVARQHIGRTKPFLRLRAICHDCTDGAHIGFYDDACTERTGAGDFLNGQDRVKIRGRLAAILLRNCHPHQTGVCQVLNVLPAVFSGPVPYGRLGCKFHRQFPGSGFVAIGAIGFLHNTAFIVD